MQATEVARWNKQQIEQILHRTQALQNEAWVASIQSGTRTMERGWGARLFPRRTAKAVLALAVDARQRETEATSRWYLASLMESLAILRILSLTRRTGVAPSEYLEMRDLVIRQMGKRTQAKSQADLGLAVNELAEAMQDERQRKTEKEQRLLNALKGSLRR